MSTDLTFVTNEAGNNLRDRFDTLLSDNTQFFDCLVGYFYISGRILVKITKISSLNNRIQRGVSLEKV